jgi:hypothetical protein
MTELFSEVDANFEKFFKSWTASASSNWVELHKSDKFKDSYRRISALQGVKADVIIPSISAGSAAFFVEAHNDVLSSHVNASLGAWRSALQNLRSALENTLSAMYFKDHPVELKLWSKGRYRPSFSELYSYMLAHPDIEGVDNNLSGLDLFKAEYATLSKAVHGSAVNFRMTDDASEILLWSVEDSRLGAWADREAKVVRAICLLCLALFRDQFVGTQRQGLRTVLSTVVPKAKRQLLREKLKIAIPDS